MGSGVVCKGTSYTHEGTGVLGSSAVLTASQTTRLGKGSSVMTRDECTS